MAEFITNAHEVEQYIRDAFEKANTYQPSDENSLLLHADWMPSPTGPILLAADTERLHFVIYLEQSRMFRKTALLQQKLKARIEVGHTPLLDAAIAELNEYFSGRRQQFEMPLALNGTLFQKKVWEELLHIPFGQTISYAELAQRIGNPSAFRAVAQANAQNPIAIIVPCHRVINANGDIGGYSAGLERKRLLLQFERDVAAGSNHETLVS